MEVVLYRMFLMGKQGNADVCPLCGGDLTSIEEHSDWITWYYYGYKSDNGKTTSTALLKYQ